MIISAFKNYCISSFSEMVVAKFCYNHIGYRINKFDTVYNDIIVPFTESLSISGEHLFRYMDSVGIGSDITTKELAIRTVVNIVKSLEICNTNDPLDFFVEIFSKEIIDTETCQMIYNIVRSETIEEASSIVKGGVYQ